MKVTPIKTPRIEAGTCSLLDLLDAHLPFLNDRSVVVITSKIVSLCENRVIENLSKEQLIKQESQYYLNKRHSRYGHHFTIAYNTLLGSAGIDESNVGGGHLLLPVDPQQTANQVREHLNSKMNLNNIGVLIVDSTSTPLRLGTTGIYLAHSGFIAVKDYVGQPDLFGHKLTVSRQNTAGGLAAAAVVAMGEGTEQTPICIISEVPFVSFQSRSPSKQELDFAKPAIKEDLFEPFLSNLPWQKGQR